MPPLIVIDSRLALVALAVGVAGLVCLGALWWLRRTTGFAAPFGRAPVVVASDTGVAPSVMLRDPALGLRGRPDYLIEEQAEGGGVVLVPIEVKPSRRSKRLYEGDMVQLGAYLLALRATHGERAARFGYVRYATDTFRVELTEALETRVRDVVAAVRVGRAAAVVHRSHAIPARCVNCPVRERCDEALA